jgi:hypothetical protein
MLVVSLISRELFTFLNISQIHTTQGCIMKEDVKYGILYSMVNTFEKAKLKDSTLTLSKYPFPFLYLHNNPALNQLTQPHGTQSPQLLDKLVGAGYLTKYKVKYFLTEKALEYTENKLIQPCNNKERSSAESIKYGFNIIVSNFWFKAVGSGLLILIIWQLISSAK